MHFLALGKWLLLGPALPPRGDWTRDCRRKENSVDFQAKTVKTVSSEKEAICIGLVTDPEPKGSIREGAESSFHNLYGLLICCCFFASLQFIPHEVIVVFICYEDKSRKLKGHTQFQLFRDEPDQNTDILSNVERKCDHLQ